MRTISLYIQGVPIDIGYYKHFPYKRLFFEIMALVTLFHECKTPSDYLFKKHGEEFFYDVISREEFAEKININYFLESVAEDALIIDITDRFILGGDDTCPSIETSPVFNDFIRAVDEWKTPQCSDNDYADALRNYYIPFDVFKPARLWGWLKESELWQDLLSVETHRLIKNVAEREKTYLPFFGGDNYYDYN